MSNELPSPSASGGLIAPFTLPEDGQLFCKFGVTNMLQEEAIRLVLIEKIRWLTRLRWIAIGGILLTSYVTSRLIVFIPDAAPFYAIAGLMTLFNVGSLFWAGRSRKLSLVRVNAVTQCIVDSFSLVSLIHFTGGIENPFFIYFVFHAMIAGILLPRWLSYSVAFYMSSLFGSVVFLEYSSFIPHYHIDIFPSTIYGENLWQNQGYILAVFFILVSTLFLSVYFTTYIMERLRKTRNELVLESNKYETVIENMADGVIFINPDGRVAFCNSAAERIRNVKREDIVGKTVFEYHPTHLVRTLNNILDEFKSGKKDSFRRKMRVNDDYSYNTYTPVFSREGKFLGAMLLSQDLTERKRLESDLIKAERLATIGKMSARVAHEIKNPLSSISLNIELLHDELKGYEGVATKEAINLLASIMAEVDRLTGVSEEYLQFARLPNLPLKARSVNAILLELTRFLREEISEDNIILTEDYEKDLPLVAVDENQMKQAFLNILKNSFEAMPDGGKLCVRTGRGHNGAVVVHITDTGIGIDEEKLEKIFDPFYTTKDIGTGLGLAVSQQIIREHGGEVHCQSAPGQGTTFAIQLPKAEEL
ncbi:MAG: Multi-sensor signal transduction histidine kinase [Candidatus Daviesbacteria bacterium GW2011_GWF2_38_6]|uniref:histidine kinase n=1 Tax=Candidatus Daviesbacteria bacterium GW2011_GWF2_38_6 TaxID=1618432 RepID=A0A0G0NHG9_9BACT|nr:MAG: Multi-sensor signal transduction histidine kinase [Candidatus Daviesbacteria bacterium GW2011_GWF2_38_6]